MIRCCRANGVLPFVALHHFSSPKWLAAKGGWEAETVVADFTRYCVYVMERLGPELEYVCTINEANMRRQFARIQQKYQREMQRRAAVPEGAAGNLQLGFDMKALLARQQAAAQETAAVFGLADGQAFYPFHSACTPRGDALILQAHQSARDAIKALCPHCKVGLTLSLHDVQALPGGEKAAADLWEEEFRHYLPALQQDDFLGVQNYTRTLVGPEGEVPAPAGADVTDMGYEFYPEGLAHVLRRAAQEYKGDLIVTENGVAAGDDTLRQAFLRRALEGVQRCLEEGIPVKGYLHWSLLDNFEWQKAYTVQFGLVGVDRATQRRSPKPSLTLLGSFAP